MELIYPLTEKRINPYIGRCVCAVLHDGSYFIGKISRCDGGMLYFDGYFDGLASVSTKNAKTAMEQVSHQVKAKTSAFFPGAWAAFAISLAALAFLFAVPFFFI